MYSQQFIEKVKKLYPNSPKMHELAISGNEFLGRYLDDGSPSSISINRILVAISLEELQKEALNCKEKINLYKEWAEKESKITYKY